MKMDNNFASFTESAASILVVLPTNPRFDEVAAGLSLYLSLRDKALIYSPSPMTVGFNRLIGVNKISQEVGNKNLAIRFTGYDATNIDKVSYDIENGEFKLTVVPKNGLAAPEKKQLDLGYEGALFDLVILVGGVNDASFPILSDPEFSTPKVAHIGIRTLESKREVMSFAAPGASISELTAKILREGGLEIDPDIATNLVMGIEEGTSNFAGSDITPETFEIFASLLRSGGQRTPRIKLSPSSFPPGSIPGKPMPQPIQKSQEVKIPKDVEGTEEKEEDVNPPSDWLQPKVYKGTNVS